jgi:hypothetical protein
VIFGLVATLGGAAGYALNTAGTAHNGAIPSAGPTVSGSGFGGGRGAGGGFGGTGGRGGTGGPGGFNGSAGTTTGGPGAMGGGMGGLLDATTPGTDLVKLLEADAGSYTWVAATVGSNNAAGYQLATGSAVMAIGGFNGTDAAPSLAQFEKYVAEKKIHYFIASSIQSGSSGSNVAQQIATWVAAHHKSSTVDGVTVYDLTS